MTLREDYDALIARGKAARSVPPKGIPCYAHDQIRNQCWNCDNYPEERNPQGDKGYYTCQYCGASMHL